MAMGQKQVYELVMPSAGQPMWQGQARPEIWALPVIGQPNRGASHAIIDLTSETAAKF